MDFDRSSIDSSIVLRSMEENKVARSQKAHHVFGDLQNATQSHKKKFRTCMRNAGV